jgi:hypothetical protein
MNIEIEYDGEYPNLCSGDLVVIVDGVRWEFPSHSLRSGGCASFDENWTEHITEGNWIITEYPEGFPEDLESLVEQIVNDEIPHGCCGGCV